MKGITRHPEEVQVTIKCTMKFKVGEEVNIPALFGSTPRRVLAVAEEDGAARLTLGPCEPPTPADRQGFAPFEYEERN